MHNFRSQLIPTPEFDYNFLMSLLQPYRQPWSKIRYMLKRKEIIRIKKGLYVKNSEDSIPFSECILANMIYGPSYISGQYALSWHGMIPEGVVSITSVTTKPSKTFRTPVGAFTYRHLSPDRYSSGFIRVSLDDRRAFLIASPEKALIDTVFDRDIPSPDKLYQYLTDDLRIDDEELRKLDMKRLRELKRRFHTPTVDALVVISQELKS